MVNSFDAIKAAQRAKHIEPGEELPEGSKPIPESGARINRTAMPTKHEITCYECGFEFHMTGKTSVAVCSKCRTKLDIVDHVIDGPCTEPVKTAGRIHLTSTGILKGGSLFGADVRLEGLVESGTVQASRRLELGKGVSFDPASMKTRDLWIQPDAVASVPGLASFRSLNISGVLKGDLRVAGRVVINPGGLFEGRLEASSIEVEEGGGLDADLVIQPSGVPAVKPLPTRAAPAAEDLPAESGEDSGREAQGSLDLDEESGRP